MVDKMVFMFEEVDAKKPMKDLKLLYGGKGAGLVQMTDMGLPVPEGFIIPCKYCIQYAETGEWPEGMKEQIDECVSQLQEKTGRTFGDVEKPLLVSVRSGAPESMPGMMDTVLNLGMTKAIAEAMAENNPRFAWDAWRRFIMMFGDIVMGVKREHFDKIMDDYKAEQGKKEDIELTAEDMKAIADLNMAEYESLTGGTFPEDPMEQLYAAINAVFKSWDSERAVAYRKMNKIPNYGTAVTVMRMVFGNMNDNSGTGVLFTRDPNDGDKKIYGDFLFNAQGEDVVAGVRTPIKLEDLGDTNPDLQQEIYDLAKNLEQNYKDMQDCEFTVEDGKLYFLQTRTGKRAAAAAVQIAIDLLAEGLIDEQTAVLRVEPDKIEELLHKRISPKEKKKPITKGYNASPGVVSGGAIFNCNRAIEAKKNGEKVILVRKETKPEDFPGMLASIGVLTSRGGKTCHAAVVARGIGLPAVVGAGDLEIDEENATANYPDGSFSEGDVISIDGASGNVFLGTVDTVEPEISGAFADYMALCDKYRTMGVRTNADTPEMAANAMKNGAEGIGLCRTERMFNAKDRLPKMVAMIIADSLEERIAALDELKPLQKNDFIGLFKAMDGRPCTIRLLDPPLHEFLPDYKTMLVELTEKRLKNEEDERRAELEKLVKKYEELRESNAMLGHRGVRLGNTNPEIYKMQVQALIEALVETEQDGVEVKLEIMLPLLAHVNEFKRLVDLLKPAAEESLNGYEPKHPIKWGTMIEVPRACLTSAAIGSEAEFFSFGTNDLTQATFAFSRDDVEGKFLLKYVNDLTLKTDKGIVPILTDNPFEHLDLDGVGRLVKMSVEEGRAGHAEAHDGARLEVGICGEVGGDPLSIDFLQAADLDYVSCSPFRVPVARVAAAHAAIKAAQNK
jgi:pyruvate,orthophosphate dikinase